LTIPYSKIFRFLFIAVGRASLDCTYNFRQRIMIPCSKLSFRQWRDNRTDLINCDYANRHWYNGPTSYGRIVDPII